MEEYYYFAPLGILSSSVKHTKEEVKNILTEAIHSTEGVHRYLQKQHIYHVLTFVAPHFQCKFDVQKEEIVELD